jgi:hypothetical protein
MANIGRVRVVFTGWPGSPGLATHFFHLDSMWNWAGYKQEVLNGVGAAYAGFTTYMADTEFFDVQPEVDIIDDTDGSLVETQMGTTVHGQGDDTTGQGAIATGFCLTWRTQGIVNSKHVRGRTFVVPVGHICADDNGTPTDASLVAAGTLATGLTNGLSPYGDLVVWARPVTEEMHTKNPKLVVREGSSHIVTDCTITDQFAVLRSRRD